MIDRFTLVKLTASISGRPSVRTWVPSAYEEPALTTGHLVLGVAMTDALTLEEVAVMKCGTLRDVARQNGETWAVGDILYGKADGSITNVRPDGPLPQVLVGTVFETIGVLHTVDVDVRVLPSLAELSGVQREVLANLDVLVYNGTTHAWVPRQIDHGSDLAGLTTAGAHPATAVTYAPSGTLIATTVQAALDELETKKADLLALYALGD